VEGVAIERTGPSSLCYAADCADQWFSDKGKIEFNTYYVSLGGPCALCRGALILAKSWRRKLEDPNAAHPTWYCLWCCKKYIQDHLGGSSASFVLRTYPAAPWSPHYCRAEYPAQGTIDAKLRMVEQMVQARTPEELYAKKTFRAALGGRRVPAGNPQRQRDLEQREGTVPGREGPTGVEVESNLQLGGAKLSRRPWQTSRSKKRRKAEPPCGGGH